MADTGIEWTDKVWNPAVGCSIVSPGCTNCYAMRMAARLEKMGSAKYTGLTEPSKAGAVWNGVVRLDETALDQPIRWKRPRRIFVNSMSDLFHESLSDEAIDKVFAVMALCPQHTFQVLTKRAERMRRYIGQFDQRGRYVCSSTRDQVGADPRDGNGLLLLGDGQEWPLRNCWLGVSVEDRARAARIDQLRATPAAVRFLSCEPLLEEPGQMNLAGIHWVIAGGESGPGARPMHPDWARSLRDQCRAAGVPFFMKQWGEWYPVYDRDEEDQDWRYCDAVARKTPNGRWMNLSGGHGFHAPRVIRMDRMGRRAAGHLLDGVEHREFPNA